MTVALNDQLLKPKAFIDGTWIDADDGSTADVVNPATGEVVATVPMLGQAETERAIASADAAFRSWRKRTANERAEVLSRWHQLILENADDLAAILTAEQGKPLFEAKAEVEAAASRNRALAGKGPATASTSMWKSSTSVLAPSHRWKKSHEH